MTDRIDCVVIGAGVVGLAIAAQLARSGRETIVLERERHIGSGTSSRNSEVIHAGIYYPTGSLKADLCVRGKALLYEHCRSYGVPHRQCGKLIVACADNEFAPLQSLAAQAAANGVHDLRWLEADEARALEPALRCVGALLSPSTGIIDSHQYMLSLQGILEAAGGVIAFDSALTGGYVETGGFCLRVGEPGTELHCRTLVNCAGLAASKVACALEGVASTRVPPTLFAKGNYFSLARRAPFSRLIYPAPESAGLGVHLTLDLGGQARFGPDVQWIETESYDVDPKRADNFYESIRRYWPDLPDHSLQPAYAGIRPKLQRPGEPARDFMIQGPADHEVPGLVNLLGIESPGLTASLAIAERVLHLVDSADPRG